jgi:hypothetical protein
MQVDLEAPMDESRSLYYFACEDQNCPGKAVVEYQPAIKANSAYRPEISDQLSCPICGGDMKMSPMNTQEQDLIPDPGWPGETQVHVTLYTRTLFIPAVKKKAIQRTPVPSENQVQTSPPSFPEQLNEIGEGFFTDADLAKLFRVSTRVISKWVKDERIRPVKLTEKKKRLYTKQIIEDFIDRNSDLLSRQGPTLGQIPAPRPRSTMSIEESRNLVKSMRKKIDLKE